VVGEPTYAKPASAFDRSFGKLKNHSGDG